MREELKGVVDRIRDEDMLRSLYRLLSFSPEERNKFFAWIESLWPEHEASIADVDRFLSGGDR